VGVELSVSPPILLASYPELMGKVLGVVQRFGSALNLNTWAAPYTFTG
jgi:hypothetical protein